MFSMKLLAVLAIASSVHAALPVGTKDTTNSTGAIGTNATAPTVPPVADSGSAINNSSLPAPTSPPGNDTSSITPAIPGGKGPGNTSTGQCLCPAPPTCSAPGSASPFPSTPSAPAVGGSSPPTTTPGGTVSPVGSTPPPTNDTTPHTADNSTSAAVSNSVSLLELLTAGAIAVAV